ncbi:MAG: CoA transferase [Betaproteobacteria bacterium]|nr:CoA transferase [Betaproteobacteria bacterium]
MTEPQRPGPLIGARVLELGTTVAGPLCGRLLADFGAEVIKIEALEGDPLRLSGKRFKGQPLYAKSLLRNKALVAIDMRTPQGQELVRSLAARSDLVIENFRPGMLEKWGLGYEDLKRVKPDIIMVRISGYGQDGPYSVRPGYGILCEAVGGLRYINGEPGRPPVRVNMALTDYIGGLYAAFGAVMALRYRERTGVGQYVDTALYECAFSFMETHVPAYDKLGVVAQPMGAGLADSTVNNLFLTADGVHVHIQGSQPNSFRRLALAMERPDLLEDPRFSNRHERARHCKEIDAIVQEWVGGRTYTEVERIFRAGDATFTRIYTMADIFQDPHYKARGMLARVADEDVGPLTLVAPVPRLSETPGRIRHTGRHIGQDTRRVLKELAGLSDAEIDRLTAARVVHCEPRDETGGERSEA